MVKIGEDMSITTVESLTTEVTTPGNPQVVKIKQPKTVILDKSNNYAWCA